MYACMNAWIYAWMDACTACVYLNMKWRVLKTKWTCFTRILKLFQSRTRHVLTCFKQMFEHFFRFAGNRFFYSSYGFALQFPDNQCSCAFFIFSSSQVLFFLAVCSHLNLREFVSPRLVYLAFARSLDFVKHATLALGKYAVLLSMLDVFISAWRR